MPFLDFAGKRIAEPCPEYAGLAIVDVEKQGHDDRTYRLGAQMRMPTSLTVASVPSLILMGRTKQKLPIGGICSRCATFSMMMVSAPNNAL